MSDDLDGHANYNDYDLANRIQHVCSLALGYGASGRADVLAEYQAEQKRLIDDLIAERNAKDTSILDLTAQIAEYEDRVADWGPSGDY